MLPRDDDRIDLPHLVWVLEALVDGEVVNEVRVDAATGGSARVAFERRLALPGDGASLDRRVPVGG